MIEISFCHYLVIKYAFTLVIAYASQWYIRRQIDSMSSRPFNFTIDADGPASNHFRQCSIADFRQAAEYIRQLPYGRNTDKTDLLTVFKDNCGTCSTKHALLKLICNENEITDIKLFIGLFRMSGNTTPEVADTLARYNLAYIPEAHCYLRYRGEQLDYTKPRFTAPDFEDHLLIETEITPSQITSFKVEWHMSYLEGWLKKNLGIPYSLNELWSIREECIAALSV
jgi:hypothetical protein